MVRGLRDGTVTKAVLLDRLQKAVPDAKFAKTASLPALLGHAMYHRLVSKLEVDETTPRVETTMPCYLHTYVTDPYHRSKIDQYVVAASKLYRRGSLIMNAIAQRLCGPRHPGATDCSVPVLRPRWQRATSVMDGMRAMVDLLEPVNGNIESNPRKHAFLPERWPSAGTARCAEVVAAMTDLPLGPLPPVPDDWRGVMSVSGWDNSINRMMSKFCGNVKVHAMANLGAEVKRYLWVVPLAPDAPRALLQDAILRPLRPLIASDDDWDMAMDLRQILMGPSCHKVVLVGERRRRWFVHGYAPDTLAYSTEILLLHLFLVRYGTRDRSYLPVATRGRKYAYIDAKVATQLFRRTKETSKAPRRKRTAAEAELTAAVAAAEDDAQGGDGRDASRTVSCGELLGLTPELFNRQRRRLRASIRRKKRANHRPAGQQATSAERKKRLKERKRWARVGASSMPKDTRIDSIETDAVGLRMVIKTKIAMGGFVVPVPRSADEQSTAAMPLHPRAKRKR
ncbi:MAG: hypothetical protein WCP53_14090, partial [Verrucomicrobiota bacterium]